MSEAQATLVSPPAWVRVALDVPLPGPFDYRSDAPVTVGLRVIVPFGRRKLIGVVVDNPAEPSYDPKQIRPIEAVLDDPDRARKLRDRARRTIVERYDLRTVCLPRHVSLIHGLHAGILPGTSTLT